MKRIICSSLGYKHTIEILTHIPDEVYRKLGEVEKRIIAKAYNSKDPQIYLHGAVQGMELAGFQFSEEFKGIYEDVIKNFELQVYR